MNFKQWIIDLFKDERKSTSIKPLVAFIGTMFLCVTMTLNSFSHENFKPADSLVDAVMIITAIGKVKILRNMIMVSIQIFLRNQMP